VAMACGTRTGLLPGEQQEPSSGGVGAGGNLSLGGSMQPSVDGCTHHVAEDGCTHHVAEDGCTHHVAEDGRACESWACVGGYVRRVDPQISCGESCQLDCGDTPCPEIELSCGPGAHAGTQPGECCPSCVSDAPPCEQAQMLYQRFKKDRLGQYVSLGCGAQGCAWFKENNRCSVTCGTAIPFEWKDRIEQELSQFAARTCSACLAPQPPACLSSSAMPTCSLCSCISASNN
jgi:hypothetical protein